VILADTFAGAFLGVFLVRPDRDLLQKSWYVGVADSLRLELRRHHVAVEEGDREQMRQAVIRLSFDADSPPTLCITSIVII
jgi:hypothetical protein